MRFRHNARLSFTTISRRKLASSGQNEIPNELHTWKTNPMNYMYGKLFDFTNKNIRTHLSKLQHRDKDWTNLEPIFIRECGVGGSESWGLTSTFLSWKKEQLDNAENSTYSSKQNILSTLIHHKMECWQNPEHSYKKNMKPEEWEHESDSATSERTLNESSISQAPQVKAIFGT